MRDSILNSIYRFETPEALLEFVENNLQVNEVLIYRNTDEKKFCVTGMVDTPLIIEGDIQIYKGHASALRQKLLKLTY